MLAKKSDIFEKVVRTELLFYRNTHQAEKHETPELLKLTKISHEERMENLFVLLSHNARISTKS